MSKVATQEEINNFLTKFRKVMQKEHFELAGRRDRKNIKFFSSRGITIDVAKKTIIVPTIIKLTYKNYSKGPEKDRGRENYNVWKFGVTIDNKEIYIKLSDNLKPNAKCISFHEAEYPLQYPYVK